MPTSLEILEKLIAFPTISRTQNLDLIDYARSLLEGVGVDCTLIRNEAGTNANLYATVGPLDRGGVMLSGHTDVVPVEGQDWTVDPFSLSERDGKLYGRGTTDMKGFVACAIHAMLRASDRELQIPLHLALSYDEEIGCVGVRRMLDMLDGAPIKPRFCLVGEPTELAVATGHKGKTALRAVFHGKEVHSALAPMGINALYLASEFLHALQDKQAVMETMGVRDGDYDVPYTTIHPGILKGGTALNIVPNRCTLDFEIRNLKEDDPSVILSDLVDAARQIEATYAPDGRIEIEQVNSYPGLDTPVDSDVVDFVKSLTGANSTTKIAFGTEGGLFSGRLGIPTVVCGPGSMAQGHKPDEFVSRSQLDKCDAMLSVLIGRLT